MISTRLKDDGAIRQEEICTVIIGSVGNELVHPAIKRVVIGYRELFVPFPVVTLEVTVGIQLKQVAVLAEGDAVPVSGKSSFLGDTISQSDNSGDRIGFNGFIKRRTDAVCSGFIYRLDMVGDGGIFIIKPGTEIDSTACRELVS